MNKVLVPKIMFKNIVSDEKKIIMVYSRLFEIARSNIIEKRRLTSKTSQKYIEV